DELRRDHEDRKNVDGNRFVLRKIGHPEPARSAHLDGDRKHFVEREQEGHLQRHWHASAQRIHSVLLVERHHLLVLFLLFWIAHPDVLVLVVDGRDLGLQRLHLLHRFHAGYLQRKQREVDEDRHQDDRPAVVVDVVVGEPVHHQKQRLGDEGEPAEVDHLLQLRVDLLQNVQVLWADEKGPAVDTVATHGGSWEWLGSWICRRRGLIVENLELGRPGAWQKHGGEVSVLDSGEGKRSREGDWSVLGLFPFGGDELAGGRIVVDT